MKRKLAWAGLVLGALGGGFLALCGALHALSPDPPWPPRDWSPPTGPYKVAVMGDVQKGLTNAKRLVEVLGREGVSLTLQTGDLVSSNDDGHYRLAARCVTKLPGSFVAVPGNHDVKGGPERFLKAFGALDFEIQAGPVTFIGLNNASGEPFDLAALDARTAGKEVVVLLFHIPRFDSDFLRWLERTPQVKYVFCGHAHGYEERRVGSATVVVNGIGGDYESWQLSQLVKAVVLDVAGPRLSHRVLSLPPDHGIWDNLEHLALGHLGAWAWLGAAALGVVVLLLMRRLRAGA